MIGFVIVVFALLAGIGVLGIIGGKSRDEKILFFVVAAIGMAFMYQLVTR